MAVKEKKKKPQVEYEKQPESPTKKFDVTYAIVSVIAIIVLFSVLVTAYYKNNYIMFSPEKVAEQYVENTAGNDGYDALKYTVLIKTPSSAISSPRTIWTNTSTKMPRLPQ